jgi:hypothetical protein
MPIVTQSDPGLENLGIANAHTMLHQRNDLTLEGTLQHHWMPTKKNVMLEITWSQLLDHDIESGWYDCNNALQQYMIHF